jgi:hypothetical protein
VGSGVGADDKLDLLTGPGAGFVDESLEEISTV